MNKIILDNYLFSYTYSLSSDECYYRVTNLLTEDLTPDEVNKFKKEYLVGMTKSIGNNEINILDIREQYGSLFVCLKLK